MNESFGGDFTATQTATAGGAASDPKAQGIVPVLMKQLIQSPEGNFQLWEMTFGMVVCTAIVRSIDTSSTKITYELEDHTGRIEAHFWLEEGDTLNSPDIMLNNYVKVYGSVRSQGGKKTLMVFKMLPITDPNEVCTHILEVLNARYKAEEFATKSHTSGSASGNFEMCKTDNSLGLEGKQLAVFQAIKTHNSSEGISRQELQRKFTHISASELNNILDFMISEGHIYSSVDPDHFISTE